MSQRNKARAMMSAAGHGDQLKHVSVRSAGAGPCAAGAPNCAADNVPGSMGMPVAAGPSMPGTGSGMPSDPDAGMD